MTGEEYVESLRLAAKVTEPAIRQVIKSFAIPPGSTGLDAGCGSALRTVLLAHEVGKEGRVVGVDISPGNLAAALRALREDQLGDRVDLVQGDILKLPFADGSFDWVWCSDTLWPGHVAEDPVDAVQKLARTLKPGGSLALVYWSSQTLLPGHPALEARLDRAFAETTRYLCGVSPENQYLRALRWLRACGLENLSARSFLAEVSAPLSTETRKAVAYCFEMFWGNLEPHVSAEDWSEYKLLCDPESGDFILDRPDYYAFLTYTLFTGTTSLTP
jgi:demethylmenaquinone methyltransferase/2-methoxy-6-polyprenyl-1,4-benzoquinol methylase